MKKKILQSENMPEFDEGIASMSDYNKGFVDGRIQASVIAPEITKESLVKAMEGWLTDYYDEEGNVKHCIEQSDLEQIAKEVLDEIYDR